MTELGDYEIRECTSEEVVYDTSLFSSTIKSEFNLTCSDFRKNADATSYSFIGLFVGAFLAGFCSDRFGRKITITTAILLNSLFWVAQAYAPGYPAFVIFRVLVQGQT